ncbi:phosphoribosylformylglycinamidine cyclo-ligase [Acidaminobacter sp. JC074]|uniref:phosphoribosylformylglycinamidine cyclo-ligase n=1 Tax=Acidaminobacter sp. JC074 TaxID=2530199 RepID=UPI001F100FAA|nr:phosphoribosylformylglycinamidine cyclo-ligase [Acidaminobacter sp. JC074]MCH4889924.1 phosphoribosylformylglycinamidine cyclo-ligase [Acidaminobacter sp. JC074]
MSGLTYKDAGVDIEEGAVAVEKMKQYVKETFTKGVLGGLGGFGGMFELDLTGYTKPVLVSGTDGVGTKLKIAIMKDQHDTVGIDLVAMCVNDVLVQGAKPLFFLDYIATGKLESDKVADLVKGISEGCKQSGAALIGGETAEMPGFYSDDEYDMAGFTVGIVDKDKIIDGSGIEEGQVLIGLPSTGVHSNGYSLVRKLFFDALDLGIHDRVEELNCTVGQALITPTKIYVKEVLKVLEQVSVKGMVHVTGGGFIENIPRILPEGMGVDITLNSWPQLDLFNFIQDKGKIQLEEMYKTFNMGIGFIMIVDKKDQDKVLKIISDMDEKAYVIGQVKTGHGVNLC